MALALRRLEDKEQWPQSQQRSLALALALASIALVSASAFSLNSVFDNITEINNAHVRLLYA